MYIVFGQTQEVTQRCLMENTPKNLWPGWKLKKGRGVE